MECNRFTTVPCVFHSRDSRPASTQFHSRIAGVWMLMQKIPSKLQRVLRTGNRDTSYDLHDSKKTTVIERSEVIATRRNEVIDVWAEISSETM